MHMFSLFVVGAAISLAACAAGQSEPPPAAGETAEAAPAPYSAAAFFETTSYQAPSPAGFAFSPDGTHLLFSSDASGVFNAYVMPVEGGEPRPLTESTTNATYAVSFFPNDRRILFTADEGGDELNHLFVREEDGSVRDLTPGDKVKAQFAGWNADGSRFYAATNERDERHFDVYAYDAASYDRSLVFRNEDGYAPDAIASDGSRIALLKTRTSADDDIYVAPLGSDGGGEPVLITAHEGNISHSPFDFTPDGRALVFGTNENGEFTEAVSYDLATGARTPVVSADWDVGYLFYSPSGRYRVHAINADGSTRLTVHDTQAGRDIPLSGVPDGNLGQVRFNAEETRIAFIADTDTSPDNIYVADLSTGAARRLTNALNPAIDETHLVEASVARFDSYDGLEIPGILYRPRTATAANPAPAVVLVHGGPGGQSTRGYNPMVQYLVNHGYAIYAINNRGSSGYGKTFFHMDDKRHGDADLRDVVASKGFLQGLDWIADDRIAVAGGSYGGYMTAAALAFHPEVFDAGINIFGVTNWERTLQSIPPYWEAFKEALYDEMGDPETHAERHRAISPLFHAERIEKPMLVIQGANDPRVLQVESDEIVAAVRENGVPVDYVVFPDEGHGFLKRENRIAAAEAMVNFLDRHVGASAR